VRNPASLRDGLAHTQAVFLMVSGTGEGLDHHAILEIIASSGARRVVLLSSIGTLSRPKAASHEPLRLLESEVQRSGLAWTILRPGGFASNAFAWIPSVRAQRTIAAPFGDVAIPVVDPADIASVAAAALRDARHSGAIYELTGPAAVSPRDQTHALSAAIDAPLTFVELTRDQAAETWRNFMPAPIVETTLDVLGAPNAIERRVSSAIEDVLARPAQSFAMWAKRNVAAFR
jgi:uncharacterized protein YbjT (DUF2867 family)